MAKKKICIIGGGISGTALGYNLSLYDDAEVTLYEKAASVLARHRNQLARYACSMIP